MAQQQKPEYNYEKLVKYLVKDKIKAYMPGEREYELSTAVGNLLYRFTRPECVIQPESQTEVRDIVQRVYDDEQHRLITVKCGGHSYTGFSTVDKGILMDLKRMTEVDLELDKQGNPDVAIIQGGARWGDVYRALLHHKYRGYVVNGGRCPSVGVGGFLLGGGLGPFTRSFGMGSDTLVGATIVTIKDGHAVTLKLSEKENKDLFWAIRGGGCAAFGIVTEFRMKIQKLKTSVVTAARYLWIPNQKWKAINTEDINDPDEKQKEQDRKDDEKAKQEEELRNIMNEFYTADWPNEMTIDSNWMMDVSDGNAKLKIRFSVYYNGPENDCDAIIERLIKDGTLSKELQKRTIPEPSTRFLYETLALMWEEEARFALPNPQTAEYHIYSSFCFTNEANKISKIVDIVKTQQDKFAEDFKTDNASLWVTFIHAGGKATDILAADATAYPWRPCVFQTYVTISWKDKWLEKRALEALFQIKFALKEYSLTSSEGSEPASFMNFSDSTLYKSGTHGEAYYGANNARLLKLKKEVDPTGFFRWPWDKDVLTPKDEEKLPALTRQLASKDNDKDENISMEEIISELVNFLLDRIAGNDWNTFKPPQASYIDAYVTPYSNWQLLEKVE